VSGELKRQPNNFDWVTVRHECSIRSMYEALKADILSDIEIANGKIKSSVPGKFDSVERANSLRVFFNSIYLDGPSIVFGFSNTEIKILDGATGKDMFSLTIGLNDEGECRFILDGKELDSWQVRRKALEGLFFRS
jgi:hypothetical protein